VTARDLARSPVLVWIAFLLVHLWLGMLNLYGPGFPFGDVTMVYTFWVQLGIDSDWWVGIDSVWVYPILALVPMLVSAMFGLGQYASTWLSMIMILNAVAFGLLTGWGRSRDGLAAAWWWVAFLVLLGPIAIGRIDAVSVPVAMVGVILIASRPRVAAVVLALATWIKVWPAALIVAAIVAFRSRWRIATAGFVTSAVIILIALALGSGANVFSFVTEQTGRALQPESPVSTIFMWQAAAGVDGASVGYDQQILSYVVTGPGADMAIAIMSPLLVLAIGAIALLGVRALRLGVSARALFPSLALALTMGLITFNKVGSPQFITWLAVPIVLGIVAGAAGHSISFRTPAILGLVIAAMTQLLYPFFYDQLIALNPLMVGMLTVRNIFEFVLLGWAVREVALAPKRAALADDLEFTDTAEFADDLEFEGSASTWPLEPAGESLDLQEPARE
jgi:hypothetical protein